MCVNQVQCVKPVVELEMPWEARHYGCAHNMRCCAAQIPLNLRMLDDHQVELTVLISSVAHIKHGKLSV